MEGALLQIPYWRADCLFKMLEKHGAKIKYIGREPSEPPIDIRKYIRKHMTIVEVIGYGYSDLYVVDNINAETAIKLERLCLKIKT